MNTAESSAKMNACRKATNSSSIMMAVAISAGATPMLRIEGDMRPVGRSVLTSDYVRELALSILTDEQRAKFAAERELDIATQAGLDWETLGATLQREGRLHLETY